MAGMPYRPAFGINIYKGFLASLPVGVVLAVDSTDVVDEVTSLSANAN